MKDKSKTLRTIKNDFPEYLVLTPPPSLMSDFYLLFLIFRGHFRPAPPTPPLKSDVIDGCSQIHMCINFKIIHAGWGSFIKALNIHILGGYLYELRNKNKSCSCCSKFKEKAENFAKTAEKFHKLLGKEFVKPEIWKRRQDLKQYNHHLTSLTNISSAFDYESFLSCTRQRAKQPYA